MQYCHGGSAVIESLGFIRRILASSNCLRAARPMIWYFQTTWCRQGARALAAPSGLTSSLRFVDGPLPMLAVPATNPSELLTIAPPYRPWLAILKESYGQPGVAKDGASARQGLTSSICFSSGLTPPSELERFSLHRKTRHSLSVVKTGIVSLLDWSMRRESPNYEAEC